MRVVLAIAALGLAAAGCATVCPDAPPERREAVYLCTDGSRLQVTFDMAAGRALVSEDGGVALELAQQISGSGFRYADDEGASLRGNNTGTEALWTSPAGETVSCAPAG